MGSISSKRGFTIVELLIVIVVIGILAAITIISFNGIQQRATTATISSAIDNWQKIIRIAAVNGSPVPSVHTCLGSSASDFPAADGFAAGSCVLLDGTDTVSYDASFFVGWDVNSHAMNGRLPITQVNISGSIIKARGAWVYSSTPSSSSVTIAWVPQVSGQCLHGTALDGGAPGTLDGGYCALSISY